MTLFIDASVLVAIIREEPGSVELETKLIAEQFRLTSGMAIWEAARALGGYAGGDTHGAFLEVERFCTTLNIAVVQIGPAETAEAVRAHVRYGAGTGHPAKLNFGDCFAYACAKTNNARLLFVGNDFVHTDLA